MDGDSLNKSLLNFIKTPGKNLFARTLDYSDWIRSRRDSSVWPYSRVLLDPALHKTRIADEFGLNGEIGINFASQDYLALSYRSEVKQAAHAVIDKFGVHSAGSPSLCGRTSILLELENTIAKELGYESCMVFPTGWAAGFGVISGLVREADTILIDSLCHNCIQEGARFSTPNVKKFVHNDLDSLENLLIKERSSNSENGIFIVIETLYSMDSDSPDINAVITLSQKNEVILIIDAAHDFGSMGKDGHGLIDNITIEGWRDNTVVMGSFSKTFAANGGFIVCSNSVRQYYRAYASTQLFSNSISPIQTGVVLQSMKIVFSQEGRELRTKLMQNILDLRKAMNENGFLVAGTPSPIVPVFVSGQSDDEALARLTSKYLFQNKLHANLVEFPAVARGKARFRFQVMATHQIEDIKKAAEIMADCRNSAEVHLKQIRLDCN